MRQIENLELFDLDKLKPTVVIHAAKVTPIISRTDCLIGGALNIRTHEGKIFADVVIIDEELYDKSSISGMFYIPTKYAKELIEPSPEEAMQIIDEIRIIKIMVTTKPSTPAVVVEGDDTSK